MSPNTCIIDSSEVIRMNENDNLKQMMRLLLEEVQGVKESIKHLPTREELLTIQL